jgi:dipeptide/tripeptide permease
LDGAENSWAGFYEGGWRLFWALCWVLSLQVILGLGPPFVAGLIGALLSRSIGGAAAILLAAVGMLSGLAIFILLTFGACSLAERQQGAKAALKDSARFVRAHLRGTVGLLAALFLLSVAVVLAVAIPLMLLAFLLKLPISPTQQQMPLVADIPLQAVTSYLFFFALAAQYAYYRGNQPPAEETSAIT